MSVSAGHVHMRGVHIIMQRNLNVPTLTTTLDPVNVVAAKVDVRGVDDAGFLNSNQRLGMCEDAVAAASCSSLLH